MLANRHSEAVKRILELFSESGYDVSLTLVNAKDFGVAEERKMVFYIGFRKDLKVKFKFPEGSTKDDDKKISLRDIIWDLKDSLRDIIWDLKDSAVPAACKNQHNEKAINNNGYFFRFLLSNFYESKSRKKLG